MEDNKIIELFQNRNEEALLNTQAKYGAYLRTVAFNVLEDAEDALECVNDTLLRAWNSIPPQKPLNFKAYLAKIARNAALDRYDRATAAKRGGGQVELALEELSDCIADAEDIAFSDGEISRIIDEYLKSKDEKKRKLFMRRYFYLDSISDIAKKCGISESNVKTTLFRMREELQGELSKKGVSI